MKVKIPANGWKPRSYQIPLWSYLERGGKRAVAVWHRRSGKDDVCLHWAAVSAMQRVGNYWHLLPVQNQARKVLWNGVNPRTGRRRIDEAFPESIREVTRDQEMFIRFRNGSTWQVLGSDNYETLVGSPPIGVVFSEYALANPQAWAILRPIFAENDGWAVFIFTPRSRNHAEVLFRSAQKSPEWFAEQLPADKTGVFTPEQLERESRELEEEYGPEIGSAFFNQEYFVSFAAAAIGSVYGHWIEQAQKDGRVTSVPYDPEREVYVSFDLGYGDATAIWFFQIYPGEVHFIDYYEASGMGVDHYAWVLIDRGYRYHKHIYLPHDAKSATMAAGGRSIRKQFWEFGYRSLIVPAASDEAKIQAGRATMKVSWFDEVKTEEGLARLAHYHYEWDRERRKLSDNPVHDFSSHGADSFGYASLMWRRHIAAPEQPVVRFQQHLTVNEIIKRRTEQRLGEL